MNRRAFLRTIPETVQRTCQQVLSGTTLDMIGQYVRADDGSLRIAQLHEEHCLACGGADCRLCYTQCPQRDQALLWSDDRPVIVPEACDGCGVCVTACRTVNDVPAMTLVHSRASRNTRW